LKVPGSQPQIDGKSAGQHDTLVGADASELPAPPPPPPPPPDPSVLRLQEIEDARNRLIGATSHEDAATAAKELRSCVRDADPKTLEPLLDLTCRTEGLASAPPMEFRERIRLLQLLVSSHCPMQNSVLASPHYDTVVAFVRAAIQEGRESPEDRAALAEAAGDVAANLAAQAGAPLPGELGSNALLKACFDGMAAPTMGSGHVQNSAAASLGQMLPFTMSLSTPLIKTLLRHLNSNTFAAKTPLIRSIAAFTGGGPMELEGLIFTDPGSVAPYLMHLVGSPQTPLPASGLVAALQLSSADARCAAAEALQAIVLAFGPRVDLAQASLPLNDRKRPSNRAMVALQKCQTDKSRHVRAAAQAACAVLEDLQEYQKGSSAECAHWGEWVEPHVEARWVGPRPEGISADPHMQYHVAGTAVTASSEPGESFHPGGSLGYGTVTDALEGASQTDTREIMNISNHSTTPFGPVGDPNFQRVNMWLHTPQSGGEPSVVASSPVSTAVPSALDFGTSPPDSHLALRPGLPSGSSPVDGVSPAHSHVGDATGNDSLPRTADDSAFESGTQQQLQATTGKLYSYPEQTSEVDSLGQLNQNGTLGVTADQQQPQEPQRVQHGFAIPEQNGTPSSVVGAPKHVRWPGVGDGSNSIRDLSPLGVPERSSSTGFTPDPTTRSDASLQAELSSTTALAGSLSVRAGPPMENLTSLAGVPVPRAFSDVSGAQMMDSSLPAVQGDGEDLGSQAEGDPVASSAVHRIACWQNWAAQPGNEQLPPQDAFFAGYMAAETAMQQLLTQREAENAILQTALRNFKRQSESQQSALTEHLSKLQDALAMVSVPLDDGTSFPDFPAGLGTAEEAAARKGFLSSQSEPQMPSSPFPVLRSPEPRQQEPVASVRGPNTHRPAIEAVHVPISTSAETLTPPPVPQQQAGLPEDDDDVMSPGTRAHVDNLYKAALTSSDVELRLLQLMAMMGPGWGDVQQDTARQLLHHLCHMLQSKKALPLVLPWFRALADGTTPPAALPHLSPDTKAAVLAALAGLSSGETPQRQGIALRKQLADHWKMQDSFDQALQHESGNPVPTPRSPSNIADPPFAFPADAAAHSPTAPLPEGTGAWMQAEGPSPFAAATSHPTITDELSTVFT